MPWGESDARASELRAGVGVGESAWAAATGSPPSAVQPAISRQTIPNAASNRRTSDQPRRPGILISRWPTAVTLGDALPVCCVGRHAAGNFRSISASNTRTTAAALPPLVLPQHPDRTARSVRSSSQSISSSALTRVVSRRHADHEGMS
jgi:hypothetical protein